MYVHNFIKSNSKDENIFHLQYLLRSKVGDYVVFFLTISVYRTTYLRIKTILRNVSKTQNTSFIVAK